MTFEANMTISQLLFLIIVAIELCTPLCKEPSTDMGGEPRRRSNSSTVANLHAIYGCPNSIANTPNPPTTSYPRRNLKRNLYEGISKEATFPNEKRYFVGVLTYFKNEGHAIHEWIRHHKKWGIQHIWMIDNFSEDKYNVTKFIEEGYITLWTEPKKKQRRAYHQYIELIKPHVKWLAVLDLDEFLYSKEYSDVSLAVNASLVGKPSNTSIIEIQMKLFLPGTFKSPASIIGSNLRVKKHDNPRFPKCLYNMDIMNDVSIHGEGFTTNQRVFVGANETVLNINHYRLNSFEFVYGIKEIRGGGMHHGKYKGKKIVDFVEMDYVEDDTYLRDHSKDIIYVSKGSRTPPMVSLYPRSRWAYLKKNYLDKYNEFKRLNDGNKLLSIQQIYDISSYIVAFDWRVGEGYVLNTSKIPGHMQPLNSSQKYQEVGDDKKWVKNMI